MMMKPRTVILVIILSGLASRIHAAKKKTHPVFIRKIDYSYNSKNFEVFKLFITPGSNDQAYDMNANLLIDIPMDFHVGFSISTKRKDSEGFRMLFQYDFDQCKLMQGYMRNSIGREWYKQMKRHSNFPKTCPISKGYYFIKAITFEPGNNSRLRLLSPVMLNCTFYVKKKTQIDWLVNATLLLEIPARG